MRRVVLLVLALLPTTSVVHAWQTEVAGSGPNPGPAVAVAVDGAGT